MEEISQLRARVAELERLNEQLLRENALLRASRTTGSSGGSSHTALRRRLGSLTSQVAAGSADLAVVEAETAEDDLSFLDGLEVPLDEIGTELYLRAKEVIPQGCGLISKRPETFLPDQWPAYYSRAVVSWTPLVGVHSSLRPHSQSARPLPLLWSLGSICVGSLGQQVHGHVQLSRAVRLGAADPDVNAAVISAVQAGSFSTFNPPEEVCVARDYKLAHQPQEVP